MATYMAKHGEDINTRQLWTPDRLQNTVYKTLIHAL